MNILRIDYRLFNRIAWCWMLVAFACCATFSKAGNVTARSMHSVALAAELPYTVYLPEGYENGQLRYPVLYLLHGHGGNETDWLVYGELQSTADRLIREGKVQPFIVVMPGGANTWWVNGAKDRAEDAVIKDLIPHIDTTYRTISTRKGRMVAGLSAGGFGAVNAALKFPDLFVAAAAMSPAVYSPTPPSNSAALHVAAFQKDGKFDQSTWERLNYTGSLETYKARKTIVPVYIQVGDHDVFFGAFHSALLFQRLFEYQPRQVELRVVDGDHEWSVWRDGIGDAMRYMTRFAAWPQGVKP